MKSNNPTIRPVAESDFPEIISIVEEISDLSPEKKAQFNWDRFQIRDELKKSSAWVSEDGSKVKAFVCIRETADFFEITVLATAVVARNQGHQSTLMGRVIDEASLKKKNVLLEVHEENLSAINFYRKCGFSELPSRKNYYSDGKAALVFIYRV